jgi:hypothetical protein
MFFASNILIAGSNPNFNVNETVKFPTSAIPFYSDLQMVDPFFIQRIPRSILEPALFFST